MRVVHWFGWWFSVGTFLTIVGGVVTLIVLEHFSRDLPDYSQLASYEPAITTRLYAGDGQLMAEYAVENRVFVPIEAIPDHVIQAFVSAEDQHFYRHGGIDLTGIARAIITNVRNIGSDRRLVGASTITQQVAKNFLLTNEVSFGRKIREQLLAMRMERAFSKDQILELYLNDIYLGGSFGVAAASMNYFNKSLAELSLAEAAYLAALPKAPNNYHPTLRTDAAIIRRNYVLGRMLDDGAITAEEADAAMAEPLVVAERRNETELLHADYFAEEVRREVQDVYGTDMLYGGGLTVRTTMDPELQAIAEAVLRDGLIAYDLRHGWRGPVTQLDAFDDWPGRLAAIEVPAGSAPWRMAVVLEVYDRGVRVGLADRSQGMIPWDGLSWARPWRENQRVGPEPQSAADVLALGDVILVEAADGLLTPEEASPGTPVDEAGAPVALPTFALRQLPDIQGALVAMDPHTGRVLAVSGGYSFAMSEFNRATQADRQPGSSFKPFVYLTALLHGFTPASIVLDTPLAVDQGAGLNLWRPDNYSHDYMGAVPLRVGIERSRNIMTVRLLLEVGLEPVREVAQIFGIYEDMPLLYSMALGAGETTPLALTTAYAMLVNGGLRIEPTFIDRIQDRTGATIYEHDVRPCDACLQAEWADGLTTPALPDTRERIVDPVTAYQMVSMLSGVVQRGTAARLARLGIPLAGKTGTTNDAFDTWFVGFSPDLAVGVFVGFDNPRTLGPRETGGSVAAPIFGAFMEQALDGVDVPPFRVPRGATLVSVNRQTGGLAVSGDPAILEAFRPGTEPTSTAVNLPGNADLGLGATEAGDPNLLTTGTGGIY